MLYMIIERFRDGDAAAVYQRFRERGRQVPEGITYVASWVNTGLTICYQVMECDDATLLDQWSARWDDLIDFEVIPVPTSAEAVERVAPLL